MIRDEMFTAYLDDELPEESARQVEQALGNEPRLKARLERLALNDERLRLAFDAELDRPLPARLLAAAHGAERVRSTMSVVSCAEPPFPGPIAAPLGRSGRVWIRAARSILRLAAGLLVGGRSPPTPIRAVPAARADSGAGP